MVSDSDSSDLEQRNRLLECVALTTNPFTPNAASVAVQQSSSTSLSSSFSSFPASFTVSSAVYTVFPLLYRPPPERGASHNVSSYPLPSYRTDSFTVSGPSIPIGLIERLHRQLDSSLVFEENVWNTDKQTEENEEKKEKIRLFRKRKKSAEDKEVEEKKKRKKEKKENE
jgi:hypothetical protein